MTPDERRTAVRRLAELIAHMTESDADSFLRAVGASMTPPGWGFEPYKVKRLKATRLLEEQSESVLEDLAELLSDSTPSSITAERSVITAEPDSGPSSKAEIKRTSDGPIFVVHGHDRAALHESVRVLERGTAREVIVLREQANAGRTILEKFEGYAAHASFAVVLLTGDDAGGIRSSSDIRPRGRQNVIFELGFFFGKLGRDRVVVLHEGNVEKPSDISGLAYISLDQAGAWKQALARELEAAGISVDRARIP